MMTGTPRETIPHYMNTQSSTQWIVDADRSIGNSYFSPQKFYVVDRDLCRLTREISGDELFGVVIEGEIRQVDIALTVGFAVFASTGEVIFWSLHTDSEQTRWPKLKVGHNRLVGWIPEHSLNEGEYRIEMMSSLHYKTWITRPGSNAPSIGISIRGGLSQSPYWIMARPGLNAPILDFEVF